VTGRTGQAEVSAEGGQDATAPEPFDEQRVELPDGRHLGLAHFGDPDGFAVLWFHGTPGARRQIPPAAIEHAEASGVRIVGMERPGVGWSSPHRYERMADWATDVGHVADMLPADRFGVIGLSGGGPYTLACAALMPDRVVGAAVLGGVAPTHGPDAPVGGLAALARPFNGVLSAISGPFTTVLDLAVRNVLLPVSEQAAGLYVRFGPEADRAVLGRPEMMATLVGDLRNAAADQFKAIIFDVVLFGRDWGFQLTDIQVPVWFWHGDADFFVPLSHGEAMAASVEGAVLHFRPGAGHLATLDGGVEALELILAAAKGAPGTDRDGQDAQR
jgi:pimeloyl-ACP methyl ester carboxylesterase